MGFRYPVKSTKMLFWSYSKCFQCPECGSCVGKRFGMMNPKMCKAWNVQEIRTVMVRIHNTIRDHVPFYSSGFGFSCRGVAGPWPFVGLWVSKVVVIEAAQAHPHHFPGKPIHPHRDEQPIFEGPNAMISLPHARLGIVTVNYRLSPLGAMGERCRLSVVCGR